METCSAESEALDNVRDNEIIVPFMDGRFEIVVPCTHVFFFRVFAKLCRIMLRLMLVWL